MEEFIPDAEFIPGMVCTSRQMVDVSHLIDKYASTVFPVIITGESGVGKELVARAIHIRSQRHDGSFVPVNCANISEEMFESDFFGHERGSFTGAFFQKSGLMEVAHRGTLFLDEVTELPLRVQAKLLRVLEDRTIRRVGATKMTTVDFRIVCATNKNIEEEVQEGSFREDLYYRICTLPVHVPTLRERPDDIRILAQFIVFRNVGRKKTVSKEALEKLSQHLWPGNVRELKNVMKRAIALSGDVIEEDDIVFGPQVRTPQSLFDTLADQGLTLRQVSDRYMQSVIQKVGSKAGASRVLQISNRTVRSRTNKPPA